MATDFDSILRSASGVESFEEQQQGRQGRDTPFKSFGEGGSRSNSLGSALAPVLQLEKSDAMFWLAVIQTVTLIAIWAKL